MVNTKKIIIIALCFIVLILLFYSVQKPIYQDEGVFLTISQGLINNNFPYTDFFDHKTPLIYFLLIPFLLLGKNIILLNIFLAIVNTISSIFIYFASEKLQKGSGLLSSLFFLFTIIFFEGNYIVAEVFITLLLSISLYLIFTKKKVALVGLLISLTLLLKQTVALLFLPFIYYFKDNILKVRSFILGYIIPIIFLIAFMIIIGFSESFSQIFLVNFGGYPREPLGKILLGLKGSFLHTWPIWILSILGFIVLKKKEYKFLFSGILLSLIPFFFVRHYSHYWVIILPIISILASLGFKRLSDYKKSLSFLVAIVIVAVSISSLSWYVWISKNIDSPKRVEQEEATEYINSLNNEYILCENQFTGFYYLSNKKNVSKYLYLTEVNESEEAEEVILEILKEKDVIILWPKNKDYAYAKDIQNYIQTNYRSIKEYSNLEMVIYSK